MGHDMLDLKNYATKQLKFKQGKLLEEAHSDGRISDMVHAWAKKGVCMAATANWLKNRNSFHRSTPLDLIDKSIGGQFLYRNADSTDPEHRTPMNDKEFLSFHGLKLIDLTLPNLGDNTLGTLIKVWDRDDKRWPRAACITFEIARGNGDSAGHAVGVVHQQGQPIDFFDPNYGWYNVTDVQGFCRKYLEVYKNLAGSTSNFKLIPIGWS